MSDETLVETTAMENTGQDPDTTSNPVPATPQVDNYEVKVKAAEERVRREEQSKRDKLAAELHRTYQDRERAVINKAKGRLHKLGDENVESFDSEVMSEAELVEFRALKNKQQADARTKEMAAEICGNLGVDPSDARLTAKQFASWQEYTKEVAKLAAQDERAKLAAERDAETKAQKQAVNHRVESGELSTLQATPAPLMGKDATVESVSTKINELSRSPSRNAAQIAKLSKQLEELMVG